MIMKPDAKEILFQSLEELIQYKNINNITVQQIIDNCQMSRSTFYRNFKDKFDLMVWGFAKNFKRNINNLPDIISYRDAAYKTIEFLEAKKDFYVSIAKLDIQNSFREIMYNYFLDYSLSFFKKASKNERLPQSCLLSIQFCCAGTVFLILEWIKRGCDIPVPEFTKLLCDSIPHNLSIIFE